MVVTACGADAPTADPSAKPTPSNEPITIPRVYPPVRAGTPAALIADPQFARVLGPVLAAPVSLASVVRDRIYTAGPTDLLRILSAVDARIAGLDPRPSQHPCLTAAPIEKTFALPAGASFPVRLQCLQHMGDQWVAFGFGTPLVAPPAVDGGADAGDDAAGDPGVPDGGALGADGGGDDFYLAEGMTGGMGGAYHVDRATGNVDGWIIVADSRAPMNSQVVMHLFADRAAGTVELSFAGTGVGFCAAHVKTGGGHIFVSGKTNAPPPPGAPMTTQSCDSPRTGCFDAAALGTDLGDDAPPCTRLSSAAFALSPDLDASGDPGANVNPAALTGIFDAAPAGVPSF
jgi:hypothetical protein